MGLFAAFFSIDSEKLTVLTLLIQCVVLRNNIIPSLQSGATQLHHVSLNCVVLMFVHRHIKEVLKWKRFSSLQPYQWEQTLVSY